jgi:hypothetical protein
MLLNNGSNWYYTGMYKVFRLEDLTTKEWEALSADVHCCTPFLPSCSPPFTPSYPLLSSPSYPPAQTTQTLIKNTFTGRKNTSLQNIYETVQLYAVGVLLITCDRLQCVGFNQGVYCRVLEQVAVARVAHSGDKEGLGMGGSAWNAMMNGNGAAGKGVGGVAGGIARMSIGGGGGARTCLCRIGVGTARGRSK